MKGAGGFLRDNIEAFAVAIAMALVIRHFCLEAFRIPTGSMMPTLLGDEGRRRGDRILVDKFAWLRRAPRRFEVAVFQYPLNRRKNFIKRIGGLPGEKLRIADGDIWTSRDGGKTWSIQRKPPGVREELMFDYYPQPEGDPGAFRNIRAWDGDDGWEVDETLGRFAIRATEDFAALRFTRKVLPYPSGPDGYFQAHEVGDVRVSFDAKIENAGELAVEIMEHAKVYRLVLGPEESYVDLDGTKHAIDFTLESEQEVGVSFTNVDDTLIVEIDGDATEILMPARDSPDETPFDETGNAILVDARKLDAELTNLRIDRDLHYAPDGDPDEVWDVPAGHYFMLGDNTQHSKDSRLWKIAEAHLANGEVIRWEPSEGEGRMRNPQLMPSGGPETTIIVAADIEGHTRRFKKGDVVDLKRDLDHPFVSRDHLVGRAFSVFWPIYLPPLSKSPTRVKLIR